MAVLELATVMFIICLLILLGYFFGATAVSIGSGLVGAGVVLGATFELAARREREWNN